MKGRATYGCHAMHDEALLTMKMMAMMMMMMVLATQQLFKVSPSIYYSLIYYNFIFFFLFVCFVFTIQY